MLGSNPSAVAGDGNMRAVYSQMYAVLSFLHVSVLNAINPRALARNKYSVGPPEALSRESFKQNDKQTGLSLLC